jgi:hypothetical protein
MARADLKYIIGFETNDSDVVMATKRLKQLQDQVKFLDNQQKQGVISANIMRKGQKQLNDEIARLRSATQKGGQALRDYITQVDKGGKALRRKEIAAQQAGYQVQDFIVQVQGGTNPLVAFSQQASQLAGFFAGPWGAMIGLGIAAVSGLVMAFSAAGRASKELKENLEKDIDSMNEKLRELYTGLNPMQQKLTDALAAARAEEEKALTDFNNRFESLARMGVHPADMGMGAEEGRIEKTAAAVREAQEALDLYNSKLKEIKDTEAARAREEKERQKIASDTAAALAEQAAADKAAAADAEARRQAAEKLLENFGIQLKNRGAVVGLEGESLLLAQQRVEKETILRQLAAQGKDISDYEVQVLLRKLGLQHQAEVTEYRINKAKKDNLEAEREAKRLAAENLRRLQQETQHLDDLASYMGKSFEDALVGIVDGTSSVKDAFRSMAADIIRQLYRVLVVQQMVGSFDFATGEGSGLAGFIGGLFKRENGGPVSAGTPYLVGERGPELFVPSSNGNVMSNKETMGGTTVVQNINISTGVQQTVRAEIRQMMPQIAQSAKAAVVDGKRRGGSYGRALA